MLGGAVVAPAALAAPEPEVPTGSLVTGDTPGTTSTTDPTRRPHRPRSVTGRSGVRRRQLEDGRGLVRREERQARGCGPADAKTLLNHYLDGAKAPTVPTYFFRTTFELEAGVAEQVAALQSTITYDDAVIVWINGERSPVTSTAASPTRRTSSTPATPTATR